MTEISLNNIYKSYGFKNVLDGISIEIKTGEIIALIGENGCGKSTILNIIAGIEREDSGLLSIRKNATIGYLKQIPDEYEGTVKELLYEEVKEILDFRKRLEKIEKEIENGDYSEKTLNRYSRLQEEFINIGGYEVDTKINKIIDGFKINHLLDKEYKVLSGGEKRIVSLAAIMIKKPDILLLDEPTNHLDINTLEWFENYLKKYKGTILIVSHDRYFLDQVATKIVLIERGKEVIFHGNYSYYIKENEARITREFQEYKDQQKLIQALKRKIKQLEEFGRLAYPMGESFFRRAENIRKRLNRIQEIEKPITKKELPLNFDFDNRSGKEVIVIKDYDLKIGDRLLIKNINLEINYQDKICIMGANGCGKSTLIKRIIENNVSNIRIGSNVKIGYIPQEIIIDENITILDYVRKFYIGDESHLRSTLNRFAFYGENVFKRVNKLSGGEKVRLKLLELIHKNSNLIILDEPTNHIDISTKETLEEALKEFNGTVIFISHDRYFINKLADKILYIENNRITEYLGNYEYFLTKRNN